MIFYGMYHRPIGASRGIIAVIPATRPFLTKRGMRALGLRPTRGASGTVTVQSTKQLRGSSGAKQAREFHTFDAASIATLHIGIVVLAAPVIRPCPVDVSKLVAAIDGSVSGFQRQEIGTVFEN